MASDLPPGWTRYTTDEGKDYFHNAQTDVTQWMKPEWPVKSESFGSTSDVYTYQPTDLELSQRTGPPGGDFQMTTSVGGMSEAKGSIDSSSQDRAALPTVALREAADGQSTTPGGGFFSNTLAQAQTYFDVSTEDVVKRIRLAMLPTQASSNVNDFRARPDFWGPFWVATTAVLFLSATGNFARLLEMDSDKFSTDYGLVSLAASMIYGCLIGVPAITRGILYLSGQEADSINFRQLICVYGYSLTAAIPASIICVAPIPLLRYAVLAVALGVSLLFIRNHLWSDISIEAPGLKWTTIAILCLAQASIFIVYGVYGLGRSTNPK